MDRPIAIGSGRVHVPETHAAFAAWVGPHLPVLATIAARQVGAHDGPDIVQEALIRAWRRRETYRQDLGEPRAWLIAIVLDQCRRHRRSLRRFLVDRAAQARSDTHHDDRRLDDHRLDDHRLDLEHAIRQLPRRQREVVVLHYLGDLAVAQVADVLGIAPTSVKTHLYAARKALRSFLEI